ncbi:MAG: hypothetical protein A2669_02280 [Candidatus Yanofskybacteria bacterium RIFCSPHIGHO2_01_FULL_48_25b]|uniref:Uncharacterized protein n=1 Tax=Candidatus Yanofskybacteria bacterium RIFCSPHIGHO2_01_FULL_48_25b TaxID=1802672 RepID=A0A1F8F4A9_9BACT|nr:MAG: hypothetical protein A2669_02280 [Candidatus Yanofskybacteria bacterium RIFCSPHIGHO2_01_FULL_48_25b]
MYDADQNSIKRALANNGVYEDDNKALVASNTNRMREIVEKIRWPTISKVGESVSNMAWLLVQHADHDVEFQKMALELMKAVAPGDVSKRNIAYLEDRVRVNADQPQLYGTQFSGETRETYEPKPIEDPERVDERRKEMGMETLGEYRDILLKKYFLNK